MGSEESFIYDVYKICLLVSQNKKEFCAGDVIHWIARELDSECPNNNFYLDQGKITSAIELLEGMKFLLLDEKPPYLKSSLYAGPTYYRAYKNKHILKFIDWISLKYIWIFLRKNALFKFIKALLVSSKASGVSN